MDSGNSSSSSATTAHPIESRAVFGVWVPLLTPLHGDLSIDTTRLVTHARWCLEQGCHGIALFGTTGEANSFTVEERTSALEALLAAGIEPQRLMIGSGCCAVPDSIRLTRHAVERGCYKVLVLPPFYYKNVPDEGLLRAYAQLIEGVGEDRLQLILYHFPKMSGIPISAHLVRGLRARFPRNLIGIKDSTGDWTSTAALIEEFPDLCIFPGTESLLLDALDAGGSGCITATANINAGPIRMVFDAWLADDGRQIRAQEAINRVRATIQARPMIPALKQTVAHHLDDPAWRAVRAPLMALAADEGEALLTELEARQFVWGAHRAESNPQE